MKRTRSFLTQALTIFVGGILTAQSVLAYQPEKNFWAERRRLPGKSGLSPLAERFPQVKNIPPVLLNSPKDIPLNFHKEHTALISSLAQGHGHVRKVSLPVTGTSRGPVLVYIQDVHMNAEVQWNIRETVRELLQTQQVRLLALEGASGPLVVRPFADFSHKHAVRLAADYLLKQNEISGPIHAVLTAQAKLPRVVGIENDRLYQANISAYRAAVPLRNQTRAWLASKQADIDKKKPALYSPALLALDKAVGDYRRQTSSLGDYLETLAGGFTKNRLMHWPSVEIFLAALRAERSFDFNLVEAERAELVDRLTRTLGAKEIELLVEQSLAYRSGRMRYADFYGELKSACARARIATVDFPAMDAYIRYVLLADSINAERLLNEIVSFEKEAYRQLAVTPQAQALAADDRRVWLTSRLIDFALTPQEWQEYQSSCGTKKIEILRPYESFYTEAESRDAAMAENILSGWDFASTDKPGVGVVVAGGFHSDGLTQALLRRGMTVVSFVPKIEKTEQEQGSAYLSVFSREKTPLEKMFQGEKLFLAQNPWKQTVAKCALPLMTVLAVGLTASFGVSAFDFSALYQSLGGEGRFAVEWGAGIATAVLTTKNSSVQAVVRGDKDGIENVAYTSLKTGPSTPNEPSEVVVLGGGKGAALLAGANANIKSVKGPIKVVVSNLSDSGRSAALQDVVAREWSHWSSLLVPFIRILPRWMRARLDLAAVGTVPYMGYAMQALEAGIHRPWLQELLKTEISDFSGKPSEWLERSVVHLELSGEDKTIFESIKTRLNSIPTSLQNRIRTDTVRQDTAMVPRVQPIRNLLFLGALYKEEAVLAPGILRRSAYQRCIENLVVDLHSSVVPVSLGLETARDVQMVGLDQNQREATGEKFIELRSEIGPIHQIKLLDGESGRPTRPMADPRALRALREARQIFIGPANLTTLVGSLAPAGVVDALVDARRRGARITWFFHPVQNQETEGLTPLELVDVLERSLSSDFRPVRLGEFVTDVVMNVPSQTQEQLESFLRSTTSPPAEMSDPEFDRETAENVSGFWQGQTPEEIQVELETRLKARVYMLPAADFVGARRYEYDPVRILSFLTIMRSHQAKGRLVGIFDKDDTLTKANTILPLSMAEAIVRSLWAGFIFVPHTASSFEELVKHLKPIFPLPKFILGLQLPMIASILDARLSDRLTGEYQPALTEDLFDTVSQRFEENVRNAGQNLIQARETIRKNAIELVSSAHRHWPGYEKEVRGILKEVRDAGLSFQRMKPSFLALSREKIKELIERDPQPPAWLISLAEALGRPQITSRDVLGLFVEVECVRANSAGMTDQEILAMVLDDLAQIDPELPSLIATPVVEMVRNSLSSGRYEQDLAERGKSFNWLTILRSALEDPDLQTRHLVVLWLEALLANERSREVNFGAHVERRIASPGKTAAGTPDDLNEVYQHRRVQYVLRGVPTRQAQTAAWNRAQKAIGETGLPMEAVAAGTSSINFVAEGQSKKNALALLARLFNLALRDMFFSDDKPNIGEVRPAVEAVGVFVNAGQTELSGPLPLTTVISAASPKGVENFINDVATYLEVINPGVPVWLGELPPMWKDFMRRIVEERYLAHLRRGTGPFEAIGGNRLAGRANSLQETLYQRDMLQSVYGKAREITARGVRYVICVGSGGIGPLASLVDQFPSDKTAPRLFSLDYVDPVEMEKLKKELIRLEATMVERVHLWRGSLDVEKAVWRRARQKSALVGVAKDLTDEGREEIEALIAMVSASFGQADSTKPSQDVVIFADPPLQGDDRNAAEANWTRSIGAQRFPIQFDHKRDFLKRHLHPGLPYAFLLALKGQIPAHVFNSIVSFGRRGAAEDGFVRLAAWLKGYFQLGKTQVVLVLPPDLAAMGPLTSRSVEPNLLSNNGYSPQVAYGLPLEVSAYPSASQGTTVFLHVRRVDEDDENFDAMQALREAGHPVAEILLPNDPAVAFGVWMEGMFRLSSILGALDGNSLVSKPVVDGYEKHLAEARYGSPTPRPSHPFENMEVEVQGMFDSGRVSSDEVDRVLQEAGIVSPNGADRYAAGLLLLKQKSKAPLAMAEIRYLGSALPALQNAIRRGQRLLALSLKKIVRVSYKMNVDYRGSLVRALTGSPVLLETLIRSDVTNVEPWESGDALSGRTDRLVSGETLEFHQRAVLLLFKEKKVPHAVLHLSADEAVAARSLERFFDYVDRRLRQLENRLPPSLGEPRVTHWARRWLGRFVSWVGDGSVRFLKGVLNHFNIPFEILPGVVPSDFTSRPATGAAAASDPMNFRHLPERIDGRSWMAERMGLSKESHRLFRLMPDARKGTYSVNDLDRALADPAIPLEEVARDILDRASPQEKAQFSSPEKVLGFLARSAGVDQNATALIPLSPELCADPALVEIARSALKIHKSVVFFSEKGMPIPPPLVEFLRANSSRALLIDSLENSTLFVQSYLKVATLEFYTPVQIQNVQAYLPPGYVADLEGVIDGTRFGKRAIRPMQILAGFERLWKLARLIAQQA